jgi:hypothetical protein
MHSWIWKEFEDFEGFFGKSRYFYDGGRLFDRKNQLKQFSRVLLRFFNDSDNPRLTKLKIQFRYKVLKLFEGVVFFVSIKRTNFRFKIKLQFMSTIRLFSYRYNFAVTFLHFNWTHDTPPQLAETCSYNMF